MTQNELKKLIEKGCSTVIKDKNGDIVEIRRNENGKSQVYKADFKEEK